MISEPVNKSSIRLPIVVLLIPIDGFYSGAGASSISARHSHPHQMAPEGTPGAQTALHLLSDPGRRLSSTQVGVILAGPPPGAGQRGHHLPHSGQALRHRFVRRSRRARRERFDGPDFRGRRSDGAVRIERFLLIPTGRRP
jgi:hypothetical protein